MRSKTVFYNAKVYLERGRYAGGPLQEDGIIKMTGTSREVLEAAGEAEKV